MTNSNERREYWLTGAAWAPQGRLVAYDDLRYAPDNFGGCIHVIEYAALDDMREQMQKEIDVLTKSLDDRITKSHMDSIKLREALLKIHKAYKEHDCPMTRDDMWKIANEALKNA